MEHLTKQQIVLLTLFTSFVTSIATGIVTVALVDQAPAGVTSTIDRVIEQTVEEVTPSGSSTSQGSQSASVSNAMAGLFSDPADQIANATAVAQKSLVRIMLNNQVTGLGVVVSSKGIIMSDKSTVEVLGNYVALMPNGVQYPLQVLQSQNNGDVVFLIAEVPSTGPATSSSTGIFIPATFAPLDGTGAPRLGETVIALSGTVSASGQGSDSTTLTEGIISKINESASSTIMSFGTNIDSSQIMIGGPLFDASGQILGLNTLGTASGAFYPVGYLKSVIPALQ